MSNQNVQDSRNFFVLPQGYEGGGYYSYGTPTEGRSQYAHPLLISMIQHIAFQWTALDDRKFGVGNISLADGIQHPDHKTHRSGLEVDIRLVRKDGRKMPCTYREFQYDQAATAKLIQLFNAVTYVKQILFNDAFISGVKNCPHHDDHFHVALSK